VGLLIYFGNQSLLEKGADATDATGWPSVEARVMSSDVNELSSSNETSFSTKVCVRAKFSYIINDNLLHSNYVGQWTRMDYRDWAALLKPGNSLKIRVSSTDQNKISLVDYNQIQ
jgi:hypothetical protein